MPAHHVVPPIQQAAHRHKRVPRRRNATAGDMLTMVLHIAKHVKRIPALLQAYAPCLPRGLDLAFQVKQLEVGNCSAYCSHHGALWPCRCIVERTWPQMQHKNLYHLARGRRHLLFVHGDMWLNMRALLRSAWLYDARHIVTANQGVAGMLQAPQGNENSVVNAPEATIREPVCLPIAELLTCSPISVTGCGLRNITCTRLRCSGTVWNWFFDSHLACARAARLHNVSECCVAWSDVLFLPRHVHGAFRTMAKAFWEVFHEVAIPTILNAIARRVPPPTVRGSRGSSDRKGVGVGGSTFKATDAPANQSMHTCTPWMPVLDCAGGCCEDVLTFSPAVRARPCAHRMRLERRHLRLDCGPEDAVGVSLPKRPIVWRPVIGNASDSSRQLTAGPTERDCDPPRGTIRRVE